jgi:hypothetical protein
MAEELGKDAAKQTTEEDMPDSGQLPFEKRVF